MATEKLPPQNLEAEQAVLGALMIDQEALFRVADFLRPEDFYQPENGIIYQAILDLSADRQPIDVLTLTNILEKRHQLKKVGGASYISQVVNDTPTSANVVSYGQIIKDRAILRNLISAGSRIVELGFEEERSTPELLDQAEQLLFKVSQNFLKEAFVPIKSVLTGTFERIDELHKNKGKLRGVATGFRNLDNVLAGLQNSDMIILAARPSMGKTSFAISIAVNAAVKYKAPVGLFSIEQSRDQIVDRMLVSVAEIDSWRLRTGNLSDSDFPKIGSAMGILSESPIFIDDSPLLTIVEMRAKARRLQAEQGLGLLIVDYLQLMDPATKSREGSRVQEISEISRGLKAIARELNVPVLALSQLSRAVEMRHPKIPQLADLRESGCLAGDTKLVDAESGARIPIKELVGQNNFKTISLDKNLKLIEKMVSRIFPSGRKTVYEITTALGRQIKASANHPFLDLFGWKRLDELKKGDHIALARLIKYKSQDDNLMSDEKIILLAHLIGDGCYLARHALQYTNADKLCLEKVSKVAQKAFSVRPRLVRQKNCYHLFLPAGYKLTHNKRNPIVKWLDEELGIFNQRSGEKRIPEIIFQQNSTKISLFLKHLWATDGSIGKKQSRKKIQWQVFYGSKSKELAIDVQELLLRLGIISVLRKNQKKGYQPNWHCVIEGKINQLKFLNEVGIFGEKNQKVLQAKKALMKIASNPNNDIIPKRIWTYIAKIKNNYHLSWRDVCKKLNTAYCGSTLFKSGLSRKRLGRIIKFIPDHNLKNLVSSDIYWDKIIAIKKLGIQPVYDATIDGTHNFVANGIIVENSLEQDADVVMFIYRDDYYNEDSERKNIADILIKKHRNGPTGQIELYFVPEQMKFQELEKRRAEEQPVVVQPSAASPGIEEEF